MKRNLLIVSILTLALAACGGRGDQNESTAGELQAIVSNVTGEARLERDGENQPLEAGAALHGQDAIITGEASSVEIAIRGFGIVKISANTHVRMQDLSQTAGGSRAELRLERGEVASFVDRESQTDEFQVVTPTAIAGVRGTAFMVRVDENARQETRVKVAVLSGAVAIRQEGQQEEVIITENSQLVIEGQRRIARDMVRPLSPESLQEIRRLAVFHRSNVLEFNRLLDDLQQSSPELTVLEGDQDIAAALEARDARGTSGDSVERARRADVSEHLRRDTEGDPITLEPERSYEGEANQ